MKLGYSYEARRDVMDFLPSDFLRTRDAILSSSAIAGPSDRHFEPRRWPLRSSLPPLPTDRFPQGRYLWPNPPLLRQSAQPTVRSRSEPLGQAPHKTDLVKGACSSSEYPWMEGAQFKQNIREVVKPPLL